MRIIQGLEDYKLIEVQNIVLSHVDYLKGNFHFEDLDFSIQDITLFGSRVLGLAKKNSDLDIKIKYTGNALEDDLFNALNERRTKLKIENIQIDFYPEKIKAWVFPRRGNYQKGVAFLGYQEILGEGQMIQ